MKTGGKTKVYIKWTLDMLMTVGLLFLMGYQFWGEAAHEWVGAGMFLLFIFHQILNRNWYRNLFKGRYTPARVCWTVLNFLLMGAMLSLLYSGITMSRHVFSFLPFRGGMALARRLHILGAYWGFVLMSLHLGLHWGSLLRAASRIRRDRMKGREAAVKEEGGSSRVAGKIWSGAGLLTAAYGLSVFFKRDFPAYMLLKNEFVFLDYEESRLLFFLDYLALMGLFVFLSHYGMKLLRRRA